MVYDVKKREMNIFEIVSLGFAVFRENFRGYIDIVLLLGLPLSIIFTFISNTGKVICSFLAYQPMLNLFITCFDIPSFIHDT